MVAHALRTNGLTKAFSPEAGIWDVSLNVRSGEVFVLLGPSGCGKTTTLRLVAGLEEPDSGDIFVNGSTQEGTPAHQRDVAFVFQQPVFLPHLTVAENIAYPVLCRQKGVFSALRARRELAHSVAQPWAARLRIERLLKRQPATLSGGEAQRAAIARALAKQSSLVLLDEPLANLDRPLRQQLRRELSTLLKDTVTSAGTSLLYVTHDQEDAILLGDTLGLMRAGRLVRTGRPAELYRDPPDLFTAQFLCSKALNLVPATVTPSGTAVFLLGTELELPTSALAQISNSGKLVIGIWRDAFRLSDSGHFSATLRETRDVGDRYTLLLERDATMFQAESATPTHLPTQAVVRFRLQRDRLLFFDPETGRRLADSAHEQST